MVSTKHSLIPEHRKLSSDEVSLLLSKYNIANVMKLPKIKKNDPALIDLGCELADVVEITRTSFAGESKYFRVIVD